MNNKKFILFILIYCWYSTLLFAKESIQIEVKINNNFNEYSEILFESPAYAVLALQNSGNPISLSKQIVINNRKSISLGFEKLEFYKKESHYYYYNAFFVLPFGKEILIKVKVDHSNINNGILIVSADLPFSNIIPKDLIIRIESKIQTIANENAQRKLIDYLSSIAQVNVTDPNFKSHIYEAILFDSINKSMNFTMLRNEGDKGKAEPLKDQIGLITSILIWILAFPFCIYLIRKKRLKL